MSEITYLHALEILDSRGRPTLAVTCRLASGATAAASVPSGASTGSAEAHELRDGDPSRYGGLGCRLAVANVNTTIAGALQTKKFADQADLDHALITLDGTSNKSNLGANAVLGVSLAFARAMAVQQELPLYRHFATMLNLEPGLNRLPRPTINLFSGGKHAGGQIEIQDVLIVAGGANSVDQALAMTYAVYQAAGTLIAEAYDARMLVADEGGLAPEFPSIEAMYDDAVTSIDRAGLSPGLDVALCVDVAASHFHRRDSYLIAGQSLSSREMIERIGGWVTEYPIVSIEDGLAEDDWSHWPELRTRLAPNSLTLGDDLLATHPDRIRRAISEQSANALLLKVNQIGTLTEAAAACTLARQAGWRVVVSARSGETEDDWLTDLAVGWGGDALKVGSITRSERLAKWNRLLAIESETGWSIVNWPNLE